RYWRKIDAAEGWQRFVFKFYLSCICGRLTPTKRRFYFGVESPSILYIYIYLIGERKGRGAIIIMRDRSRMAIDPRIPIMPERSTSGFHRPGRLFCEAGRG
ncbi:unnamed protein product, partial [Laminaria digitata]